jgi:hypothetical protein
VLPTGRRLSLNFMHGVQQRQRTDLQTGSWAVTGR